MEKPMIRNVLKTLGSIRTALAVAAGIPFLIAVSAYAQTAPAAPPTGPGAGAPAAAGAGAAAGQTAGPGAAAEVERVIVTGSNIPTAEEVGPNPVLNLNRDAINKAGERNAEELLKHQPVANAQGVPISNNATGFTPGAASVSLRGFSPSATLVLVDGRRVAPYPLGQGGTSSFIDLFTIPRPAIESIEVLKDGASTTYGADAIAGVVNIKLYKVYHGAESTIEYGNTLDKDAAIYSGDVLFGTGDDKVQVTGMIDFYHHNSMFNRDRGNSAKPPFLSTNSSPENLQLSKAVVAAAGGPVLTGTNPLTFAHAPFFTNGLSPASAFVFSAGRSSLFNFNQFSGSFPESERWGAYTAFSDKICDDQLVIYGDAFYQDVKTHNELAPAATGSFETPGQATIAIPPHMPLNGVSPPNTPTFQETGLAPNAFNPFNPFNQIISGGSRARLAEFGNRLFDNESDAWLTTLGIKGDKLFDGSWGYDTGFRYSQIKNTSVNTVPNVRLFNRILNAADPIFNPASNEFIGTTIPFNPFTDFRVPFPSNNATVAFAAPQQHDIDTSKMATTDFNIYTTDLFSLPAGGVGLAFGGQFRRENFIQEPDLQEIVGEVIGSSASAITHAGRKDYAFYGETLVPIFSPTMGVPFFHALEVTGSVRFEEFLNNDTNVMVPKVGYRWQPFNEELTIRSTWGEGFREPSLIELFASPTFGLTPTSFTNPATGVTTSEPETATKISSNPLLQPEDSRSWSGGIVYTPKWIEHFIPNSSLTMSIDLWDIERRGVVVAPPSQEVVRRFETGTLLPGEVVLLDPSGTSVNFVQVSFQNAGRENARGADFGLQYQQQTSIGVFTWLTQASYLDSFIFQATTQSKGREVSGYVSDSLGGDGWLKWKGFSRLDWTSPTNWGLWDVNVTCRYTGGFREQTLSSGDIGGEGKFHFVHATWFFDGQLSYELVFTPPVESAPVAGYSKGGKEVVRSKEGKAVESTAAYSMPCWKTVLNNTKITVGCNDIFGQDPPPMIGFEFGNANNYPGFLYDNLGRFVYVDLTKKF
jgi:iron complex outermembrane receptor protein